MRQVNVFPECYVDTNLMFFLLGCAVKHKSTCNEVVKAVNRANVFAIGVIDADKRLATMDAGFVKYQSGIEADGTQHNAKPEVTKQFFVGTLDKEDLLRYLPR